MPSKCSGALWGGRTPRLSGRPQRSGPVPSPGARATSLLGGLRRLVEMGVQQGIQDQPIPLVPELACCAEGRGQPRPALEGFALPPGRCRRVSPASPLRNCSFPGSGTAAARARSGCLQDKGPQLPGPLAQEVWGSCPPSPPIWTPGDSAPGQQVTLPLGPTGFSRWWPFLLLMDQQEPPGTSRGDVCWEGAPHSPG